MKDQTLFSFSLGKNTFSLPLACESLYMEGMVVFIQAVWLWRF